MLEALIGQRGLRAPPNYLFLGEVAQTNFLQAATLRSHLGLGGSLANTNTPWLKFILDDKTLYVPKQAIATGITWTQLYSKGAVYGTPNQVGMHPQGTPRLQDANIIVHDKTYRIRLLSGSVVDPFPRTTSSFDEPEFNQSEWARLFYPICNLKIASYSHRYLKYAQYNMIELGVHKSIPGHYTLCQELHPFASGHRVVVGGHDTRGIELMGWASTIASHSMYGWRPVLELVQ